MKKKIMGVACAFALALSMSSVAFAGTVGAQESDNAGSAPATYTAVIKAYTVTGSTDANLYPAETLSFTSVADPANPDGGNANLTINDLVVNGNNNQNLTINVPSFNEAGTYHFTISETAGNTQGVTYTAGTIAVSVLVTYDYADSDGDDYLKTAYVGITANGSAKVSTFTNDYGLGSLAVTKEVTGNLGDTSKEFNVDVTFTATKDVKSAITYVDGTETKTISVADMADKTETVTVTLKHGETVNFTNIPAGVTYTVVEDSEYSDDTNKNGENGYDAPVYAFSDSAKTIAQSETDTVKITNNKSTTVDTAAALESMPFVVMLVAAGAGLAAFAVRRRQED